MLLIAITLIAIELNAVGVFISGVALLVGILTWWISKLLADKKEVTELQVKIQYLEERMEQMEHRLNQYFSG